MKRHLLARGRGISRIPDTEADNMMLGIPVTRLLYVAAFTPGDRRAEDAVWSAEGQESTPPAINLVWTRNEKE